MTQCERVRSQARKNYGFWLPFVLSEMGKGKREAGTLGSTFEMTYGAASLFNGVLVHRTHFYAMVACAMVACVGVFLWDHVRGVLPVLGTHVFRWGGGGHSYVVMGWVRFCVF